MKILVTGGSGFVGSFLCEALLEREYRVICVDNLLTGNKENITHLLENPLFSFLEQDIITPLSEWSQNFLKGEKIDKIYNLACPASPNHYQKDPVFTLKTAVIGTLNMLDLAKAHGAHFLQASTSEVYGDPMMHPQKESYRGNVNSFGPRACYDEGKRAGETACFDYIHQYGLKVRVVRIFNTYGPRMQFNDGRVVSNFVLQALKGEPISIYGNGDQTRSFCYVDDLVDGLIRAMDSLAAGVSMSSPINLGNPNEFTILDFAKTTLALTKSESELKFFPLPTDDPTQRQPDITLAKKLLNWEPKLQLRDGLLRTIDYFRAKISQSKA